MITTTLDNMITAAKALLAGPFIATVVALLILAALYAFISWRMGR